MNLTTHKAYATSTAVPGRFVLPALRGCIASRWRATRASRCKFGVAAFGGKDFEEAYKFVSLDGEEEFFRQQALRREQQRRLREQQQRELLEQQQREQERQQERQKPTGFGALLAGARAVADGVVSKTTDFAFTFAGQGTPKSAVRTSVMFGYLLLFMALFQSVISIAIAIGTVGLASYVATKVIGLENISNWIQDNLGGPSGPLGQRRPAGSTTDVDVGAGAPAGAFGARPRSPAGAPAAAASAAAYQQAYQQPGFQQAAYQQAPQYQQQQQYPFSQQQAYQQPGAQQYWDPAQPQQPRQQPVQLPGRGQNKPNDVVDVYYEDDWGR